MEGIDKLIENKTDVSNYSEKDKTDIIKSALEETMSPSAFVYKLIKKCNLDINEERLTFILKYYPYRATPTDFIKIMKTQAKDHPIAALLYFSDINGYKDSIRSIIKYHLGMKESHDFKYIETEDIIKEIIYRFQLIKMNMDKFDKIEDYTLWD